MPINVDCPSCQQAYNVPDDKAGKKFRCKHCQEIVSIPTTEPSGRSTRQPLSEIAPPPMSQRRRSASSADTSFEAEDDADDFDENLRRSRRRRSGGSRGRRGGSGRAASLGQRFLGALIDGLAAAVAFFSGYILIGIGASQNSDSLVMVGLLIMVVMLLSVFAAQIFLMATRSQSIGKYFVNTRVHDYDTNSPASFVQVFLLRSFVNELISGVCGIYRLIDILFIFGDENRCLHDKLANTLVVDIS